MLVNEQENTGKINEMQLKQALHEQLPNLVAEEGTSEWEWALYTTCIFSSFPCF